MIEPFPALNANRSGLLIEERRRLGEKRRLDLGRRTRFAAPFDHRVVRDG